MAESKSQEQELLMRRIPSVKRLDSARLDSIQMPSFLLSRDRSVRRASKDSYVVIRQSSDHKLRKKRA